MPNKSELQFRDETLPGGPLFIDIALRFRTTRRKYLKFHYMHPHLFYIGLPKMSKIIVIMQSQIISR